MGDTRHQLRIAASTTLALLILSTAAAEARSGDAAPLSSEEANELLVRHQPLLLFRSDEFWPPIQVRHFRSRAGLERQVKKGQWVPELNPSLPTRTDGCALSPCFRLNLPCSLATVGHRCYQRESTRLPSWNASAVYGEAITLTRPFAVPRTVVLPEPPAYLLRYWFFYYFDDWRSLGARVWHAHEADWESITIVLSRSKAPLYAAYRQHCSGTWRRWTRVQKRQTHPKVYVAVGSHASYFDANTRATHAFQCPLKYSSETLYGQLLRKIKSIGERGTAEDRMDDYREVGRRGVARTPATLIVLDRKKLRWMSYVGRWGERSYVYSGAAPSRRNHGLDDGVATPAFGSQESKDAFDDEAS